MPSTGTPSSNTVCGARAVSSSVTEAWLPDRITPRGLNDLTKSASTSCGCSSQYTPLSRTRRAISWVTWEPKSRMRILSKAAAGGAGRGPVDRISRSSFNVVIRRFLRDLHIVDVGFAHPRRRDLDERSPRAHVLDRAATRISHARAQSAHELRDDRGRRLLVRDATLDAFWHKLVGVHLGVLEVAIARALLHGAERAHAAIGLVGAPLEELDISRCFFTAGKKTAEHDARRARGDRLRDVARIADAAVGDARNAERLQRLGDMLDRRNLGNANARDDP